MAWLGIAFFWVVLFSIFRSKRRLYTVIYTVVAMGLTFGVGLGIAQIIPAPNAGAVGALAVDFMLLIGMLTAAVHCLKTVP